MNIRTCDCCYQNEEEFRDEEVQRDENFEDDCRQRADDIRSTYESFKSPY